MKPLKTLEDYYRSWDDFVYENEGSYYPCVFRVDQLCYIAKDEFEGELSEYLTSNFLDAILDYLPLSRQAITTDLLFTAVKINGKIEITINTIIFLELIYEFYTGIVKDYYFYDQQYKVRDREGLKKAFLDDIHNIEKNFDKDIYVVSQTKNYKEIKEKYPNLYDRLKSGEIPSHLILLLKSEIYQLERTINKIIDLSSTPLDLDLLNKVIDHGKGALIFADNLLVDFEFNYNTIKDYPTFEPNLKAHANFINKFYENVLEIKENNPKYNPSFNVTLDGKKRFVCLNDMIAKYEKMALRYPEYLTSYKKEEKEVEEIKEVKEPKKEEVKLTTGIQKYIPSIGDLYLTEIIVNGKKGKYISVSDINKYSEKDIFLGYFKNTYFINILNQIPNVPENLLNTIMLSGSIDKDLNVKMNISFESVLKTFSKYIIGEELNSDDCKTLEDLKNKFIIEITAFGDKVIDAIDGKSKKEDDLFFHNRLEIINNQRVNQIPFNYEEYLDNTFNLILSLCDSIEEIKNGCNVSIDPKEIDNFINNDEYYLENAYNLFNQYKNNILNGNHIIKEDYLMLAKYLNALRKINSDNTYEVELENGMNSTTLLNEYMELLRMNKLYDLETSPLYNILKDADKTKKIIASWKILPNGHIDRLSRVKIGNFDKKKTRSTTYTEDLSNVLERKELLDATDCIVIDGENEFKGYRGYYCPNGLVLFEIFFLDEEETIPAKSNATYLMNIENFAEMSVLSKPEVIEYIKDGNSDVKRIYHTSTWQDRVTKAMEGKKYTEILKGIIKDKVEEGIKEEVKYGQNI